MDTSNDQNPSDAPMQAQPDLKEISIILDGWTRQCDNVLNTLDIMKDQLNRRA